MKAQTTTESEVRVDPALIPKAEYTSACTVLEAAVRRLFSKPEVQKEYEAFLKEYRASGVRR